MLAGRDRILAPTYSMNTPASFPIQVDEAARTATVQAGVPQRIFLDYLAAYKCDLPILTLLLLPQRGFATGRIHQVRSANVIPLFLSHCGSQHFVSWPLLQRLSACRPWDSLAAQKRASHALALERDECNSITIMCRKGAHPIAQKGHAGVVLRARVRCRTAKAPLGYSIPAAPWYIDQTVGGAVSSGTHGSSLRFGSLSSQA